MCFWCPQFTSVIESFSYFMFDNVSHTLIKLWKPVRSSQHMLFFDHLPQLKLCFCMCFNHNCSKNKNTNCILNACSLWSTILKTLRVYHLIFIHPTGHRHNLLHLIKKEIKAQWLIHSHTQRIRVITIF